MKTRGQGPGALHFGVRRGQNGWGRFIEIVVGILRELSDQGAYARYLKAHGVTHSREEWQRFSDLRWEAKTKRGRCC